MKSLIVKFLGRLISRLNRIYVGLTAGVFPRIDIPVDSQPVVFYGSNPTCDVNAPQQSILISENCNFSGRMINAGMVIDGSFDGLLISGDATIKGECHFNKKSVCRKLEILPGARVTGEVIYDPRFLVVNSGAFVNANLIPAEKIDLERYGIVLQELLKQEGDSPPKRMVDPAEGETFMDLMDREVPGFSDRSWNSGDHKGEQSAEPVLGESAPVAFSSIEQVAGDLGEALIDEDQSNGSNNA